MKTLLLLIAFIIISSCKTTKIQDHRYKTFRPAKVHKIKLKKSKLAKAYRFNELSKKEKKQRSYKNIQTVRGACAPYTKKPAWHYKQASRKINPKFLCVPN